MTRLWVRGEFITPAFNADGMLLRFTWRGQVHHVQRVTNRWRVDVEWWRVRVWRDYFKLLTAEGLLVVLYRDLVTNQWYVQRLYD